MNDFNAANGRRDRYSEDVEFGRNAGGASATFDDLGHSTGRRDRAADKLSDARDKLSEAKDKVTERLAGASRYVKSRDMSEIMDDARDAARKNPRLAILTLAAVGFLLGRAMRRSR